MRPRLIMTTAVFVAAAMMTLEASARELVIGLSYGKTGRYSSIGKTTEAAVDIAVREINAKGGVNGMKIKLVKFDTAGDPRQAVVAVRKFAQDDKAIAVIGPFSSSEARVAFPAGERLGIVQIPNASSAPKLADKFSYAYRATESEYLQFIRVVTTLKKKGMLKKNVAILYAPDDVVSKAVGLFIMQPIFKQFGVKLATKPIGFRTEAFDLSPQVSQLKGLKLDYVGVAGITPIAIRVLKEMRRQGVNTPMIGGQIWADPEIIKRMGKAADGSVFIVSFWYKRNARSLAFSRKFVAEVKKMGIDKPFPHHVDASAYDTVYILAAAMRQAKVTGDPAKLKAERTAIRDTLAKITVPGVIGDICFEKNGDAQLPGYVITMKNGQWELLEEHKPLPCNK
ncbi:MAG TPA: ABC transporter substrate-binding protein [Alphaproteobacteria bacterium]|nr:ABC transporter substrate-binding protein [Alphaproteobacteria bacterium]